MKIKPTIVLLLYLVAQYIHKIISIYSETVSDSQKKDHLIINSHFLGFNSSLLLFI